jgi:hypothetical protein
MRKEQEVAQSESEVRDYTGRPAVLAACADGFPQLRVLFLEALPDALVAGRQPAYVAGHGEAVETGTGGALAYG